MVEVIACLLILASTLLGGAVIVNRIWGDESKDA